MHAGIRGKISRSPLADANKNRDWRIYAEEYFGVELDQTAYVFDSTTIDLCLSLFPWATFRKRKAAIKLHTLMDLRGSIPCFISVSQGKTNDKVVLDELNLEHSLSEILQICSITLFEKVSVHKVLTELEFQNCDSRSRNQLSLFDACVKSSSAHKIS